MPVRILVVEDNRDTLRAYSRALTHGVRPKEPGPAGDTGRPVQVEDADSVASALAKLRSQPFDVVVVDLKIAGTSGDQMGGLEVVDECLRLDPLRPVIVITGYGTVELAKRTLTQGAFDFIEKSEHAVEDLVAAVQRAVDAQDEKVTRSGNPFTRMSGYEPSVFGGRRQELVFFEERLNRALHTRFREHFLVLGSWGIGKSTLLKEFRRICQSRGHIACVVPMEPLAPGTNLHQAARWIAGGILRNLPFPIHRFERVAELFQSIGISVLGSGIQVSRDTDRQEISPQAILHDTLTRLWEDLEGKTDVLVVLLDDLDNLMPVPEIVMTLKQTLSMDSLGRMRILVGMAYAPTSWLQLTAAEQHHPLSRYFISRIELDPLTPDELRETVLRSVGGSGVSFSPAVLDLICEHTGGHPFEMQVLCYHLFDNQLSRRVDTEVWEKALQAALHDMGAVVFERWCDQASTEESKVLAWVAGHETAVAAAEVRSAAAMIKVPGGNLAKYLQRLVQKGLLVRTDRGLYAVPDPMFRAYLRTQATCWE